MNIIALSALRQCEYKGSIHKETTITFLWQNWAFVHSESAKKNDLSLNEWSNLDKKNKTKQKNTGIVLTLGVPGVAAPSLGEGFLLLERKDKTDSREFVVCYVAQCCIWSVRSFLRCYLFLDGAFANTRNCYEFSGVNHGTSQCFTNRSHALVSPLLTFSHQPCSVLH